MHPNLKPLAQQTVVITGATSGHGLAAAKRAARAGARVLLVARDEDALRHVQAEIERDGGKAEICSADVGVEADVERVYDQAVTSMGGFDTWVNNAGIGIYGTVMDTPTEDHARLFQTNYWGVVFGSKAAVRHFREKPGGGALINVGSINSEVTSPLLSAYNASKHAVRGFTNSLRLEMVNEGVPISITLIKPSAIGTPFPEHGRNYTGGQARLPPPLYSPEVTADAILYAAQHPRRSITVGGIGKAQTTLATFLPKLFDFIAAKQASRLVNEDRPVDFKTGNLFEPVGPHGRVEGRQHGRRLSLWTLSQTHPGVALGIAVTALAIGAMLIGNRSREARA